MGICFSGAVGVYDALDQCADMLPKLPGKKYLSIAGGDSDGRWTLGNITNLDMAVRANKLAGYNGICYDIENGEAGLSAAFAASFANAKAHGLSVLLTISSSQPYAFTDAPTLMKSFFSNPNIDYMSPQVYNDALNGNDFMNEGTSWSAWSKAKAKIVVSVVEGSRDYAGAYEYFTKQNINLAGYIQWNQGTKVMGGK